MYSRFKSLKFLIKTVKFTVFVTGTLTLCQAASNLSPYYNVLIKNSNYKSLCKIKNEYGDGWAIVTGATSGLGYNYAKTLSHLGYNICLISRDEHKLKQVSDELTQNYNVNTKIIPHDFSNQNKENIENLRGQLLNLDKISIVVNNVGVLADLDRKFEDVNLDSLLTMVNVNCSSVIIMYSILLKKLREQNNRSLIIDVSSLLGDVGYIHNMIAYQATKAFVTRFSEKIRDQIEMENRVKRYPVYKIDIMTLKPSNFSSGMNPNVFLTTEKPENVVYTSLVNVCNKNFENHGTFKHEVFAIMMKLMPNYIRDNYFAKERYIMGIKESDYQIGELNEESNNNKEI
jgi:short-subunit dehydrogenase